MGGGGGATRNSPKNSTAVVQTLPQTPKQGPTHRLALALHEPVVLRVHHPLLPCQVCRVVYSRVIWQCIWPAPHSRTPAGQEHTTLYFKGTSNARFSTSALQCMIVQVHAFADPVRRLRRYCMDAGRHRVLGPTWVACWLSRHAAVSETDTSSMSIAIEAESQRNAFAQSACAVEQTHSRFSPVDMNCARCLSRGIRSSTGDRLRCRSNCRNVGSSSGVASSFWGTLPSDATFFSAASAWLISLQHDISVLLISTDIRNGRLPSSSGILPLMRVLLRSSI